MRNFLMTAAFLAVSVIGLCSSVTFNTVNGQTYGGQFVGPVTLTIDNTVYNNMAWCFDDTRHVMFGETWTANLLSFSNLSQAYFSNQSGYLTKYKEAAWLDTQFATQPVGQYGPIQFAIWSLFDSTVNLDNASQGWKNQAVTASNNNFYGTNFSQFSVVIDVEGDEQGFIVKTGSAVPEPSSTALMLSGIGLLFLGKFKRTKV